MIPGCLETTDKQARSECYREIAEKVAEHLVKELDRYRSNAKHPGTYKVPYFIIRSILDDLGIELCPPTANCYARFGAVVRALMKILSGMGFTVKRHTSGRALVVRAHAP
jgi:hypothetical protein